MSGYLSLSMYTYQSYTLSFSVIADPELFLKFHTSGVKNLFELKENPHRSAAFLHTHTLARVQTQTFLKQNKKYPSVHRFYYIITILLLLLLCILGFTTAKNSFSPKFSASINDDVLLR